MRRRAIFIAAVAILAVACGIDAIGSLAEGTPPDRASDGGDATTSPPDEDGATTDDGGADAASDADAAAPLRCDASFVIDDPLTALDGGAWIAIADTSNVGFPAIETTAEGPAVALLTDVGGSNLGAIYIAKPMPILAFDVKVRSIATCRDGGACSDGLAITWLATDGGAPALQTYTSTPTFGIPANVAGAGVVFDLQTDVTPNDPASPSVSLLAINGTGAPASYDWHTKSAPAPTFVGRRDLTLSLRKGVVSVRVDGAPAIDGPVDAGFTGYFGFSASNGGAIGRFALRSLHATFYACDDP